MSWLSWSRPVASDEWQVFFAPTACDLAQAASVVATVRVSGQSRTVTPTLYDTARPPYLSAVVTQQALPNGSEGELWFTVTMKNNSTVRLPAVGAVTVRVYR